MRRSIAVVFTAVAATMAWRYLPRRTHAHPRTGAARGDWLSGVMTRHMGRMLEHMPDNAPPKLVMSVLPKIQAQNEQIIAMLREQNELLRHRQAKICADEGSDEREG